MVKNKHPILERIDAWKSLQRALEKAEGYRQKVKAGIPTLPKIPEYGDDTQIVLHLLLTENTGTHPADSGDAYGRHWQENRQKLKNFMDKPSSTYEVRSYGDSFEVLVRTNLFQFLNYRLTFRADITQHFYEQVRSDTEYEGHSWMNCMKLYASRERNLRKWGLKTTLGVGYTYNFENTLSQDIQTCIMMDNDSCYGHGIVLLQVHNGCDARGGFTVPVAFECSDMEYLRIDMTDIHASCSVCGDSWYSDDAGGHWYTNATEQEDIEDCTRVVEEHPDTGKTELVHIHEHPDTGEPDLEDTEGIIKFWSMVEY